MSVKLEQTLRDEVERVKFIRDNDMEIFNTNSSKRKFIVALCAKYLKEVKLHGVTPENFEKVKSWDTSVSRMPKRLLNIFESIDILVQEYIVTALGYLLETDDIDDSKLYLAQEAISIIEAKYYVKSPLEIFG